MEITQKLKDKIEEIAKANPKLCSVGLGQKVSGGQLTGENAIVCAVEQKKPIEQLSQEEILPSEITIDGETFKIDVIESSRAQLFGCSSCGGWNGGAATNRSFTRPLRSGIVITSSTSYPGIGTLGTFVKDVATGCVLGLTNNHVTIDDATYTSTRNLALTSKNDYSPTNFAYQGSEDGTPMNVPANIIGLSVRYAPSFTNDTGISNKIDAALFSVREKDFSPSTSWQPIGLESEITSNPPFASTAELDTLFTTNPEIITSGRTSGPRGHNVCGELRVEQSPASLNLLITSQGIEKLINYSDCISVIRPDDDTPTSQQAGCLNPGLQGDSGSAVYANINGTIKLIGLLFAGNCTSANPCCAEGGPPNGCSTRFYVCRIDHIADELGVEWFDPNGQLSFVDENSIEYITQPGGSADSTIVCDGKTYWQAGLTDTLNNPC